MDHFNRGQFSDYTGFIFYDPLQQEEDQKIEQ